MRKEVIDFVKALKEKQFDKATEMMVKDNESEERVLWPELVLFDTQEAVVFLAIDEKQKDLFNAIIHHKSFSKDYDAKATDLFGETILHRILFGTLDEEITKEEKEVLISMLEDGIDSNIFDLNQIDRNCDTLLQAMLQYGDESVIPACIKLIKNENVNITNVNDIGLTAYGCALKGDLSRLADMILERKDFMATQGDIKKLFKHIEK
jgi:hypothetical protein